MRNIAVIILLLVTIAAAAQDRTSDKSFTVSGSVVDSITKEGEPYATLRIENKEQPGKAVRMAVTGKDGKFSEKVSGQGKFVLTVSSMGRGNIVREFSVTASDKTVSLGTLLIRDSDNMLEGIEVVTQKPLVKADIDKIEYDIESDPDSKSNSILEMLRKVPLVTVDGEDNIKVNGSSSFKVYVNGRPNSMMSNNPKEVLKSMPANSIKRIEVITNPGPKYDAEGVGGILNIITAGSGMEGYTATFSGNVSNRGGGGGLFGTVKKGKLTVSARYNYNYNDQPKSWSGSKRTTTDNIQETSASDIAYTGSSKGHSDFQSGSIEASYEIDTLRLVTMSFGLWGGGYKNNGSGTSIGIAPADGGELYRYTALTRSKSSWYSIDGSIDYQRLFKVKDRMLTLSYKINTNPETSDSYTDYNDMSAAPDWEDFIRRMESQRNDGSQNTAEHTFQADYTTPIGKMHTIEGGAKYILRNNRSEDDRYLRTAADDSEFAYDRDHSSHYKHENDIIATYLGYGIKIKRVSGRLGMRYEHTIQDVRYIVGQGDNFRKHFNDIVPSASVGYKLTDMSNLRLGYNMRIYRPGIWYLNPYLDDRNPTYISQGNPDLESEKSHSFNLSYNNFTNKLSVNVSLRWQFTDNSIEDFTSLVNDNEIAGLQNPTGKEVLYSTYRNIGKSRSASISAYANWNATSSTRINTNLFGTWSYMTDGTGIKNKGWSLFAYGGIQQTLPEDWQISLSLHGQTPWIMLQGRGNSFFSYGLNVNKSFMNKRLTLSVFANNFFKKYTENNSRTESTGFIQDSWNKYDNQRFGISASFRIGELKASVKKAARTISNDDVKSGGGDSGGGN